MRGKLEGEVTGVSQAEGPIKNVIKCNVFYP